MLNLTSIIFHWNKRRNVNPEPSNIKDKILKIKNHLPYQNQNNYSFNEERQSTDTNLEMNMMLMLKLSDKDFKAAVNKASTSNH